MIRSDPQAGSPNRQLKGFDHIGDDRIHDHLHDYARDLPTLGTRSVEVAAKPGRNKSRAAQVRVAAGAVSLDPNRWTRGEHDGRPLYLFVIHVLEINAPAGTQPLEWILLSNLPAETFSRACELIDFTPAVR